MASSLPPLGPPPQPTGYGWLRENLFNSWYNTLLTVVAAGLIALALWGILGWVIFTAEWDAITSNLKLIAVGQYPSDQMWRVGTCVLLTSFLTGLSWGVWRDVVQPFGLFLGIGLGILAILPLSIPDLTLVPRIWLAAGAGLVALGYIAGRVFNPTPKGIIIAWIASFAVIIVLLRGFGSIPGLPNVPTGMWGGLLLTFILAVVGIVASLPIGILLALGRRSNLPVVKVFSVLFIEIIRGVPLVTLLFMTQVVLPLFLPEGAGFDRLLRALLAITLFSSAYMAENVRGGLQALPPGQVEAGKALGLGGPYITLFIVLPQALRAVIPAIVGQFISLFKDTSLVITVGMLDVLGIAKSIVLGNVEWIGSQSEIYLFIGFVYWIFTYSMSQASQRIETRLGVGRR